MTWPFENDTSAIVKKLAKRNVSSNRIFCFFNVLTIALAISLIVEKRSARIWTFIVLP